MVELREFIQFNIPTYISRTKHTQVLLDEMIDVLSYIDGEEVTDKALENAKDFIKTLPRDLPLKKDYEKLLKKYGYLPRVINELEYAIQKFRNNYVTDETIRDFYHDLARGRAYNIFTPVANYPPTNLAKPFEQLILDAINYNGGNATKPVKLPDTPASRYDIYLPESGMRIEVKSTRLIDATRKGDMGKRFLPYGAGKKFATGIKQIKLIYFDLLVMNIIASNVSLYALYTRDDIERIILENFVEHSDNKFTASLIHNTDKTPKDKEGRMKRVWTDEFIFTFPMYTGMKDILSYAQFVTFDVNELAKQIIKTSKKLNQ